MIAFFVAMALAGGSTLEPPGRYRALSVNAHYGSALDTDSVVAEADLRHVKVLTVYFDQTVPDEAWRLYRFDVDCARHTLTALGLAVYSASGAVLADVDQPEPRTAQSISSGSNGDTLQQAVCGETAAAGDRFDTIQAFIASARVHGPPITQAH